MIESRIMWCLVIVYFVKAGESDNNKVIDIHVEPKSCSVKQANYYFQFGDIVTVKVNSQHNINRISRRNPTLQQFEIPAQQKVQIEYTMTARQMDSYNLIVFFTETVNNSHQGMWDFKFHVFEEPSKIPFYDVYNASVECSCSTNVTTHDLEPANLTRNTYGTNHKWYKWLIIIGPIVGVVLIGQTAYIICVNVKRRRTRRRPSCALLCSVPSEKDNCYKEHSRQQDTAVDLPLPTLPARPTTPANSTDNLMTVTPIAQRSRMPTPPISTIDIMEKKQRRETFERYIPKKPPRTPANIAPPQPPPRETKRVEPSCKVGKKPRVPSPPVSKRKRLPNLPEVPKGIQPPPPIERKRLPKLPEIPDSVRNLSMNHYAPVS